MADEYEGLKLEDQYEAVFAKLALVWTAPKTYTPPPKDKLPTPWYLNPESDGPSES